MTVNTKIEWTEHILSEWPNTAHQNEWLDKPATMRHQFRSPMRLFCQIPDASFAVREDQAFVAKMQLVMDSYRWVCDYDTETLLTGYDLSELQALRAMPPPVADNEEEFIAIQPTAITEHSVVVEDCGWIAPQPYPFDD